MQKITNNRPQETAFDAHERHTSKTLIPMVVTLIPILRNTIRSQDQTDSFTICTKGRQKHQKHRVHTQLARVLRATDTTSAQATEKTGQVHRVVVKGSVELTHIGDAG